ncbi:MAG: TonB-dependent receptor [Chitinophagales bacterium]
MKIQKIFVLLMMCTMSAFAQHNNKYIDLTGQITNESGEVIPFANLMWLSSLEGVSSDVNGNFKLRKKQKDSLLVVSHISYNTDTLKVTGQSSVLNIELSEKEMLDEVNVEGRKSSTSHSLSNPILSQKINSKELEKSACCSLAESFETNPSIDAVITDAATGTRKLIMLGLAGKYMLIRREKLPFTNGIAAIQGLETFPGPWISSISLSKGVGSVSEGFEGSTGQLNVEVKKPEDPEKMLVNLYFNEMSRSEFNFWHIKRLSPKAATATLLHGSGQYLRWDRNDDNFLDAPLQYNANVMHRWKFNNLKGWKGQVGVNYIRSKKVSGQLDFPFASNPVENNKLYGINIENERWEAWMKSGYSFQNRPETSIGFLSNYSHQNIRSSFGNRIYNAHMQSVYTNLIFNTYVSTPAHKISTGLSYRYELIDEELAELDFFRVEQVPGAFFEYTFKHRETWIAQAGLRGDYNNIYGGFLTPRLHLRYNPSENTSIRFGGGRGQRTSSIIAENMQILASSRTLQIDSDQDNPAYGLSPEVSWNYGLSLTQFFYPGGKEGSVVVEYFRTDFTNQIILDLENPREAVFYNLDGQSFSNSFQVELNQNIWRKLDFRLAYRWFDVKNNYKNRGLLDVPLISKHRALFNVFYETGNTWKFDYTVTWNGPQRIPSTLENSEKYQRTDRSPHYFLMNAQITKVFKKRFELYLGMENILNYRQADPIIAAEEPNSEFFDSSLIWGPVFGRNTYLGFRFKL